MTIFGSFPLSEAETGDRRTLASKLLGKRHSRKILKDWLMNTIIFQPLVALIAGILILVQPKLLNYIVAFYLIIVGALGLLHHLR